MPYSQLLQKYVYKSYRNLLQDKDFAKILVRYGWVYPGQLPQTLYISHNDLIRKWLPYGETALIQDYNFQRILFQAGFTNSTPVSGGNSADFSNPVNSQYYIQFFF